MSCLPQLLQRFPLVTFSRHWPLKSILSTVLMLFSRIGLYVPVCNVAGAQRAQEEAHIHTGLKEVHLPRVIAHQVKLRVTPRSEGPKTQDRL